MAEISSTDAEGQSLHCCIVKGRWMWSRVDEFNIKKMSNSSYHGHWVPTILEAAQHHCYHCCSKLEATTQCTGESNSKASK